MRMGTFRAMTGGVADDAELLILNDQGNETEATFVMIGNTLFDTPSAINRTFESRGVKVVVS